MTWVSSKGSFGNGFALHANPAQDDVTVLSCRDIVDDEAGTLFAFSGSSLALDAGLKGLLEMYPGLAQIARNPGNSLIRFHR